MNVSDHLHRLLDRALDDDPRRALSAVRQLAEDVEGWITDRAVLSARRDGVSWAKIGRRLDMSRQGARQRFAHLDGHVAATAPIRELSAPDRAASEAETGNRHARTYLANQRRRDDLAEWERSDIDIVPW